MVEPLRRRGEAGSNNGLIISEYSQADKALESIEILPFEGATEGHRYYVQTKLMLAYQHILKKEYKIAGTKIAESRTWPSNLGVRETLCGAKE
ncbi:hypothetical protein ACFX5U_17140 [Sphingobacterium sp. SG20118]|uniref:hypothetical protein n=1 Tax=Sphingobacterium sp. SG20118 TaxID=3367156 RepID=UPI0037DFC03A